MYRAPRNVDIQCLVVHVNVGPDTKHTGAEQLVQNVLNTNGPEGGGYHAVHDDDSTVVVAQDNELVYGAGGMNAHGLHSCIIGDANQTAAQWTDKFSTAAMKQSAVWVASKCKRYGIPIRHLTPEQIANGVKGICGHVDVNRSGLPRTVWPGGHYDPGPNFPWSLYIHMVNEALNPDDVKETNVHPSDKVDAAISPGGGRYVCGADGGVFVYGDSGKFHGSVPGNVNQHVKGFHTLIMDKDHAVSIVLPFDSEDEGYWIILFDGSIYTFGKAPFLGIVSYAVEPSARPVKGFHFPDGRLMVQMSDGNWAKAKK